MFRKMTQISCRLLQSKASVANPEYKAQRSLLKKYDAGEVPREEFLNSTASLWQRELDEL